MIELIGIESAFGDLLLTFDSTQLGINAEGAALSGCVTGLTLGKSADARSRAESSEAKSALDLMAAYLAGDVDALDRVSVRYDATSFKTRVSQAMRGIPAGSTDSYAGLARRAARPKAVRAVGTVCSTNAIPLIVPCHRVVRSDGSLGNYYFGVEMKAALLRHEGALR